MGEAVSDNERDRDSVGDTVRDSEGVDEADGDVVGDPTERV